VTFDNMTFVAVCFCSRETIFDL